VVPETLGPVVVVAQPARQVAEAPIAPIKRTQSRKCYLLVDAVRTPPNAHGTAILCRADTPPHASDRALAGR